MAIPEKEKAKQVRSEEPKEIDPDTYLWDDDDEDEDDSDLPPERESSDDDDW
jgi:hypothetical protein